MAYSLIYYHPIIYLLMLFHCQLSNLIALKGAVRDKCKVSTSYDYVLSYGIHGQGTLDKLGQEE
jgi:hypothetical protein